jgi:hypothetical protein
MVRRIALLFAAVVAVFPLAVQASASLQSFTVITSLPSNNLFTSVGAQRAPNVQYVDAVWPVTVNLPLVSAFPTEIFVNFPDRAAVTLTRVRSEQRGPGGFIWTGRGADCTAYLRQAPSSFLGQIACHNASYEVSPAPNGQGLQLVRGIPPSGAAQPDVAQLPPGTSVQSVQAVPATQVDTSIDVLVLYTEAVRAAKDPGGGNVETKLLARAAVDQLQEAFCNSTPGCPTTAQPIAQVNLVAAIEVSRTADGNFADDLTYLRNDPEPLGLRNFWAADVVMYLTDYGGTGISGLANEPDYGGLPAPGPSYAPFAAAALQYNCALLHIDPGPSCVDYLVFPHEFAHNLGANHDIADSPWPSGPPYPTTPPMPVEPYAFGHFGNVLGMNGGYRTIMAYTQSASLCQSPCTRVPYYSNAQVTTPDGFKTGVLNQQENARVIAEFAGTTAQYRLSLGRIFYNGFEANQ